MELTPIEAEAGVARMFPQYDVYVADGCDHHESGVIKDFGRKSIGSFRLIYKNDPYGEEPLLVNQIWIGEVGQYCGTIDELRQFEEEQRKRDTRDQPAPTEGSAPSDSSAGQTLKVDLRITRTRIPRDQDDIEIWGYVGDYEVCLSLPRNDPRVPALLHRKPTDRD